jgi:hypothetical protein
VASGTGDGIVQVYDGARRQAEEDVIRRIVHEEIAVVTAKAYGRAWERDVRAALYLLAATADGIWSSDVASLTTEKVNL